MQPFVQKRLEAVKRRRRLIILLVFVAIIVGLVVAFRGVLAPFLVALFAAYLIDPVIKPMANLRIIGRFRLGRGGAILAVYMVLVAVVYLIGTFTIPAFARQIQQVRGDLPAFKTAVEDTGESLVKRWRALMGRGPSVEDEADGAASGTESNVSRSRFRLKGGGVLVADVVARSDTQVVVDLGGSFMTLDMARIAEEEPLTARPEDASVNVRRIIASGFDEFVQNLDEILKLALSVVTWLVTAIYQIFLIMMITAFLVVDREKIVNFMHSVAPQRHQALSHRLAEYIDRGLAGVIRGQLTICLVNGILTWIGLEFLDVRYALMLGVVAGTLSLIPIFGTIISTVPIVLIALGTSGWEQGALALVWILFIHFVEANILNPKIMGTASRIHPVVIIFALLAGGHTYGLVGALLAVPIASIIQSTFKFYVIDKQAEIDEEPPMTAT